MSGSFVSRGSFFLPTIEPNKTGDIEQLMEQIRMGVHAMKTEANENARQKEENDKNAIANASAKAENDKNAIANTSAKAENDKNAIANELQILSMIKAKDYLISTLNSTIKEIGSATNSESDIDIDALETFVSQQSSQDEEPPLLIKMSFPDPLNPYSFFQGKSHSE